MIDHNDNRIGNDEDWASGGASLSSIFWLLAHDAPKPDNKMAMLPPSLTEPEGIHMYTATQRDGFGETTVKVIAQALGRRLVFVLCYTCDAMEGDQRIWHELREFLDFHKHGIMVDWNITVRSEFLFEYDGSPDIGYLLQTLLPSQYGRPYQQHESGYDGYWQFCRY